MKKIIHIDMDCYYAAVEMRDNPELKSVPIAVGGNSDRSVLCTSNYIARQYGVRSAMSSRKAKLLCPNLVIIPGNMALYKSISEQIHKIFKQYTNLIEPLSLDEAYLDVTDCSLFDGSATLIAQDILRNIFEQTGLTASAGIAPLKFIAKVASDMNKPNGYYTVSPNEVWEFLTNLPLNKISGVGKVTYQKLKSLGFQTCGDIRKSNANYLISKFGKYGHVLWDRSHGIDEREVQSSRVRKSVGVERTFAQDINSLTELNTIIEQKLLPELKVRASKHLENRTINKLGVKVKFNDFQQTTREQKVAEITPELLKQLLVEAMAKGVGKPARLLGIHIGLSNNKTDEPQLKLDF